MAWRPPRYHRSGWKAAMGVEAKGAGPQGALRHAAALRRRLERLHPSVRGLLWAVASGLLFVLLNALMRGLSLALSPFQTQFLRYAFGLLVMLPFILRSGVGAYRPHTVRGQFMRGAVHALGLCLWFVAVPTSRWPNHRLASPPDLIMIAPCWCGRAAAVGALGGGRDRFRRRVMVVAPSCPARRWLLLVMLASAPVFAASFSYQADDPVRQGRMIGPGRRSPSPCSASAGLLQWTPPPRCNGARSACCVWQLGALCLTLLHHRRHPAPSRSSSWSWLGAALGGCRSRPASRST